MASVAGSFPPTTSLAGVLNASSPSVLATKAFADPNSGYAKGMRLAAALDDNGAGNFSVASGLTIASNALSTALGRLKDFQSSLTDLYSTVARLRNPALSKDIAEQARFDLEQLLHDLNDKRRLDEQNEFNLLDASKSDGVQLNLVSGAVTNIGTTPKENAAGADQRFVYSPDTVVFQALDLSSALKDLQALTVDDENASASSSLAIVNQFKSTLEQGISSLNGFRQNLASVAADRLSLAYDETPAAATGADAVQIASRLAQALHNESFSVSPNSAARFFSLFA